ncbi:MAG: competence protein CoiA [Ramlibacter sp.]|nr:competence protein CoiA [Ramlibacter sp.]
MHRDFGNPQRDAAAPDCDGLVDGWARKLANDQPAHASAVTRDEGPFYCATCHAEVILRKGAERADHFAHEAPRHGYSGGVEGALHRACKQEIHTALAAENPDGRWEVERTIPARPGLGIAEARPDISGRVRGLPVAIEVQASALGIASILQRTRTYAQRLIHVLWIVPLREQLADDGIRPRLHERYFHSLYLGRTYYWWPGLAATVLPVHYGASTHRVPSSEWYRPGIGHVRVGGYDAAYRAIKTPYCGPRLQISQDFAPRRRGPFIPENECKAVPACDLWLDRLAPWW